MQAHHKIIPLFISHNGRFGQNSHMLAEIQFHAMSFLLQIVITRQSTVVTHKALCTGKKFLRLNGLFYV